MGDFTLIHKPKVSSIPSCSEDLLRIVLTADWVVLLYSAAYSATVFSRRHCCHMLILTSGMNEEIKEKKPSEGN